MKTRLFALIMGIACIVAAIAALPIVATLQSRRLQRQAYAEAFDLAKSSPTGALAAIDRCLEFRPDDLELYKLGAGMALRAGDVLLAEKYVPRLLESGDPSLQAEAHLGLGSLYLSGSDKAEVDIPKALDHFREALKLDGTLILAKVGLAFGLAAQGKLGAALPYLETVAALDRNETGVQYASTARLWLFSETFRAGDPLASWVAFQHLPLAPSVRARYEQPLKAAVAAKVNSPNISSAVRRVCIGVIQHLLRDKSLSSQQKFVLHTLLADAYDRIGEEETALANYRAAYEQDPTNDTATRNVAYALLRSSEKARKPEEAKAHFDSAATVYKALLASGKLDEAERRHVSIALATRAWRDGRRDEARALVADLKDVQSPELLRMDATEAIEAGDYAKAIARLEEAVKLTKSQPDAQALLAGFKSPPAVRDFKVNRSNKFDPRPILSAAVLPRSVPVPIAEKDIRMRLDETVVEPIITRGGLFYQPKMDLPEGEHKVAITATDALGLTATETLTFEVAKDTAPPVVIGLTPAPDKETGALEPIIAFRCSDSSGINESSLKASFEGKLTRKGPASLITVIDRGMYRIDFARARINKGQRVPYGAGYFRFSEPLIEGEKYTVRVGVSDVRGNRTLRDWTFTATRGPDDPPEAAGP